MPSRPWVKIENLIHIDTNYDENEIIFIICEEGIVQCLSE